MYSDRVGCNEITNSGLFLEPTENKQEKMSRQGPRWKIMKFWRQIKKSQIETETFRRVVRKEGSVDGATNESKIEHGKWEKMTETKKSQNWDHDKSKLPKYRSRSEVSYGSLKLQKRPSRTNKSRNIMKNLVVFVLRLATGLILAAMSYHLTNRKALVLAVVLANREFLVIFLPVRWTNFNHVGHGTKLLLAFDIQVMNGL